MRILFILIFLAPVVFAQRDLIKDVIGDPALTYRCQELIKDRNAKVKIQQRLNSLLHRTKKLLKSTPSNKRSIRQRLKMSRAQLKNEIRLSNLKVRSMEENIVRQGCPGTTL